MNYRMMEMVAPSETISEARKLVQEKEVMGTWLDEQGDGLSLLRILIDAERTEAISDALSQKYSGIEEFRIMLFSVEATLPQPDLEEEEQKKEEADAEEVTGRISREELYADVAGGTEMNKVYLATVILSALVAAMGLLRDDVAVIIGAMVIAPLLGPNVSLALAVTLGDLQLGWKSLKANLTGLILGLSVAVLLGLILTVDPNIEQLLNRTSVSLGDITIAMAAGIAGVLAFTRGVPATIIGVMVAVALLPPLVSFGLLLGEGYYQLATGAAILTLTNIVCINLAGVLTFLVQGIRPRSWWEAKKAKKATRIALGAWSLLLIIFAILIWYWGQFDVNSMIN